MIPQPKSSPEDKSIFISTAKLALAHMKEIATMSKGEYLRAADDELLAFINTTILLNTTIPGIGEGEKTPDQEYYMRCMEYFYKAVKNKSEAINQKVKR
ncbi:MAG: hypothetical protein ABIJ85_04495 [bacterium]|nr:hypothetical protein [Patescibacteria group bacterium]